MELVVFIGIQATGKSTFYRERYFHSHMRINLDMLKTRHREEVFFRDCITCKQPTVVDNTNVSRADRARYIVPAKAAGFRVIGFFFQSRVADALQRNALRVGKQRVVDKAILGASGRLELPDVSEGFDALHFVIPLAGGEFQVDDWRP